jgi:signal transduction histidine kinase/ActR/RegA family two-component response regulator
MRTKFDGSTKPLSVCAIILIAGLGCPPLQAAITPGGRAPFYLEWSFYLGMSLVILPAAFGLWRWTRLVRTRTSHERDAEIMQLMDQWTKSLQQEVAERKEAQRALQASQEMTLRQERLAAVGQLAAGLAHEFNNILTVIQGHAALLMDNPKMDDDARDSITHITQGVERTAGLVKQMLAFSRKQVMQQRPVEIRECLGGIESMLRQLAGDAVILRFDIAPGLPPIVADPDMLQQIFVNLVANARDAMGGGGQLTIRASEAKFSADDLAGKSERRAGRFTQLSVTDTGSGIDSRALDHLFEPFFTTKDTGKGPGLGLASVYGMVKQNAGWIEVESAVGRGTTFYIYFAMAENGTESKAGGAAPKAGAGGETVLVVEDEAILRDLVREVLLAKGYRVLEAATGPEAVAEWEKNGKTLDLLLTDIVLPGGMSGKELAAKLRQQDSRLPVIFTSGHDEQSVAASQPSKTAQAFLSKPYRPVELARTVRAILDAARGPGSSPAAPS